MYIQPRFTFLLFPPFFPLSLYLFFSSPLTPSPEHHHRAWPLLFAVCRRRRCAKRCASSPTSTAPRSSSSAGARKLRRTTCASLFCLFTALLLHAMPSLASTPRSFFPLVFLVFPFSSLTQPSAHFPCLRRRTVAGAHDALPVPHRTAEKNGVESGAAAVDPRRCGGKRANSRRRRRRLFALSFIIIHHRHHSSSVTVHHPHQHHHHHSSFVTVHQHHSSSSSASFIIILISIMHRLSFIIFTIDLPHQHRHSSSLPPVIIAMTMATAFAFPRR